MAVSIVCHEIGHAIQHAENYKPLEKEIKLLKIQPGLLVLGVVFYTWGFLLSLQQELQAIKVCLIITLLSMIVNVLIHLITLDVEFDASFNRALPILKEKVPKEYHKACRSILSQLRLLRDWHNKKFFIFKIYMDASYTLKVI